MKVGDLVKATVVRAEEGYALLCAGAWKSTLQQLELTWNAGPKKVTDFVKAGEEIEVLVTAIAGDQFSCSLKQKSPDPWLSSPNEADVRLCEVKVVAEWGYFVEFAPHCHALLQVTDALKVHELHQLVKVEITQVDRVRHRAVAREVGE